MSHHPGTSATGPSRLGSAGSGAARETAGERDDRIDRPVILADVARDARLDRKFLLLVVLSTAVAVVGMLQNNMVVVIGAMLISPFLGPIMAFGFGLAIFDAALIRRALTTLAVGIATAIALTAVILLISPVQDATAEFRSRTQPTLFDLAVAVLGGIAGVYAILRKLPGVMVGVAIATALVPPLCTIAFGMVMGRPDFAFGAALLFLTNTFAIAFSATIIARFNSFGPALSPRQTALQLTSVVLVLGALSFPLAVALQKIAREIAVRTTVQDTLDQVLGDRGRVTELTITTDSRVVRVDGVVLVDRYRPTLADDLTVRASARMQRPLAANIVQLYSQTDGSQFRDAIDQRLSALETRDSEVVAVLAALQAGNRIPRQAITLDAQLRRAIVTRLQPDENNGPTEDVEAAFDQLLAAARARHPAWAIVAVDPPQPSS